MRKIISIILCLSMLFSVSVCAFANESYSIDEVIEDTSKYVYETVKSPEIASVGGEWTILGLARADVDIPTEYFDGYYESIKSTLSENQGILHDRKYTEYSRVILALTAIGKNPVNVSGYNLTASIEDYDKTIWQGVNGAIFALMALDSGNYLKDSNLRDLYIKHILKSQNADGSFSMSSELSDIDLTAMAICALSNYQESDEVKSATDAALSFISDAQLDNGGFENQGTESSEGPSQVIVALCSLGINITDSRFVKNGNTVLDNLLSYYSKGNGFRHLASDTHTNLMATEQALYALVALDRMNDNKTSLYDMSDVEVRPDITDAANGLPSKSEYIKKLPIINKGKTFADITNSADKSKIEALAERGMINGRTDTEFAPTSTMTRAEFAAIIVKSLGLDFIGENIFVDVANDSWYIDYIRTAYNHGIIKGISKNKFNPEGTITKEEAAVMVARAAKLCGIIKSYDDTAVRNILAGFTDYIEASDWSEEALAFCYDTGILSDEDIEIFPKQTVTREQIASMLCNMLSLAKLL